ncbi:MAG: ankyrin repeat domain-containing protein [Candidatus Solibacter sp.]
MPTRPNLEYYRKQAKALLKAAQSGDPAALQRLKTQETPKLHDAQLAIAREQGFRSWPRFHAWLESPGAGLLPTFIDAATSDRRAAQELLAAHPELANAGFHAALVLGDAPEVEAALAEDASLATAPGGPDNVVPLIYVCFSRFGIPLSDRAAGIVETARALLRHGADPNSVFQTPYQGGTIPLSCIYAAAGLNNNVALTSLLLDAGANPNDGESVYHSTEHRDLACFRLLLARGASLERTNAVKHMLDREELEGLRLLLQAGADPNERNERGETALHWAVWRGRGASIIEALLTAGAQLDARREDGRTAYALAVQSGQLQIAQLLARHGADTTLLPVDEFLATGGTAPPELAETPGNDRLLADLAAAHRTQAVRDLLAAGMPVNAPGELGATALHWACWKGFPDLVELLLANGASLTAEDAQFHGTPAGWLSHGSRNCHERGGDYPAVARLLIAAGAVIPPDDREVVRALVGGG